MNHSNFKFYPKVCLCGSTRYRDIFFKVAKFYTLKGCIVTMPMVFAHAGDTITDEQKRELDDLHRAKIRDADFIVIINRNGYIGESTKKEIEYATLLEKEIIYLEQEKDETKS